MQLNDIPDWLATLLIAALGWGAREVSGAIKRVRKLFSDVDIAFQKIRELENKDKENAGSTNRDRLVTRRKAQ